MVLMSILRRIKLSFFKHKFGSIGKSCVFPLKKQSYYYPSNISFGDYVSCGIDIEFYATEASRINIGNGTMIAPRVKIYTCNHNYDSATLESIPFDHINLCSDVIIGEGCWIGDSVIILPGVKIGKGAVIGAGSVVVKDIPNYGVAVGNPAHVVKFRNAEQFEKLLVEKKYFHSENKKKIFVNLEK